MLNREYNLRSVRIDVRFQRQIVQMAGFAAKVRTAVVRNKHTHEVEGLPFSEMGNRLANQLQALAKAMAFYFGREEVSWKEMRILKKLVRGCLKLDAMEALDWVRSHPMKSRADYQADSRYNYGQLKITLDDLAIQGMLKAVRGAGERASLHYILTEDCRYWLEAMDLIGVPEDSPSSPALLRAPVRKKLTLKIKRRRATNVKFIVKRGDLYANRANFPIILFKCGVHAARIPNLLL